MSADCLFCKIVAGAVPATKVYEDADVFAFNDITPKAPVHVLIVPKRHIRTLNDFTDADVALAGKLLLTARKLAADLGIAEGGYRVLNNVNLAGGQVVWHVHFHLLGGRQMTWPPG
jgi:histidine triad (HIT) family protein